jgi:hypothetical protein
MPCQTQRCFLPFEALVLSADELAGNAGRVGSDVVPEGPVAGDDLNDSIAPAISKAFSTKGTKNDGEIAARVMYFEICFHCAIPAMKFFGIGHSRRSRTVPRPSVATRGSDSPFGTHKKACAPNL